MQDERALSEIRSKLPVLWLLVLLSAPE